MKLIDYMQAEWASQTAFFGVNLKDTPAPSIKGPASEPENWQRLGTDDAQHAMREQLWRPVDPKSWLPSNLPLPLQAGGPGSGRHKGTGMTDDEFSKFAEKVGRARNANRDKEDAFRKMGNHEEANKIYNQNKSSVLKLLQDTGVKPKAFDDHMKKLAKESGKRVNVKMVNMFPEE